MRKRGIGIIRVTSRLAIVLGQRRAQMNRSLVGIADDKIVVSDLTIIQGFLTTTYRDPRETGPDKDLDGIGGHPSTTTSHVRHAFNAVRLAPTYVARPSSSLQTRNVGI
jgi:hypothetical protein